MFIFVCTRFILENAWDDGISMEGEFNILWFFSVYISFIYAHMKNPKIFGKKRERESRIPCDCVSAADDFFIVRLYYTAVEFPRPQTPSRKSHRIAHAHVRACRIQRFINNTVLPFSEPCTQGDRVSSSAPLLFWKCSSIYIAERFARSFCDYYLAQ